jgi:hypothetical protein
MPTAICFTAICFIEKMHVQTPSKNGMGEWESGNWRVKPEKAKALIGKRIYFHEKQKEPSYSGGIIKAFRESKTPDRIVFIYIPDDEGIGYLAGADHWGSEQKTIP